MSFALTLKNDESILDANFFPPIQLNTEYELALKGVEYMSEILYLILQKKIIFFIMEKIKKLKFMK